MKMQELFFLNHKSFQTRIILVLIIGFLLLAGFYSPIQAKQADQTNSGGTIVAFPTDLSLFPVVSFYFTAFDTTGKFINDLHPADVQLLENGHSVKINDLSLVQPGIQTTLAINPSPLMANKINSKSAVYDKLRDTVTGWIQTHQQGTPDDFSISTPEGLQLIREKDPSRWASALSGYQPDFKPAQTTLNSLTQALDLGTDPLTNPYMKRSILFITGLPTKDQMTSLSGLTDRAKQLGIRVSVWLVAGSNEQNIQQNSIPLAEMAKQTGGSFFVFTGSETLPDYNADLNPVRYLYHLSFSSIAQSTGRQMVGIHIGRENTDISAPPFSYDVDIQPPNPMFLAPPTHVERSLLPVKGSQGATPEYDIKNVPLKVLLEFPDGHPRQIKASRLFVNNKLVAENNKPPFDQFQWDVEDYTDSTSLTLRVEVQDSMGITSSSIDTPVSITVNKPQGFSLTKYIPSQGTGIIIALFLAGAILLLVLFVPAVRSRFVFLNTKKQQIEKDPLTQPVKIFQERAPTPASSHSPSIPRSLAGLSAPARLLRLSETGHPIPASAILLNRREITFGCEANLVTHVLDDPSVSPKHTCLVYSDGAFIISDNQSVAGTWVNYTPVSTLGVQLEHGDMIHIGRIAFRFELSVPPEQKKPRVISA